MCTINTRSETNYSSQPNLWKQTKGNNKYNNKDTKWLELETGTFSKWRVNNNKLEQLLYKIN